MQNGVSRKHIRLHIHVDTPFDSILHTHHSRYEGKDIDKEFQNIKDATNKKKRRSFQIFNFVKKKTPLALTHAPRPNASLLSCAE